MGAIESNLYEESDGHTRRSGFEANKNTPNEAMLALSGNDQLGAYNLLLNGTSAIANQWYPYHGPVQIIRQIPDWARTTDEIFEAYKRLSAAQVMDGSRGFMITNYWFWLTTDRQGPGGDKILRRGAEEVPSLMAVKLLPPEYQPIDPVTGKRMGVFFTVAAIDIHLGSFYTMATDDRDWDILMGVDPYQDTTIAWDAKVPVFLSNKRYKHWFYFSRTRGDKYGGTWPPIDLATTPWYELYKTQTFLVSCNENTDLNRAASLGFKDDWGKLQGNTNEERCHIMYFPEINWVPPIYTRFKQFCESLPMRADCVMDKYTAAMDKEICKTLGISGSRNGAMYHECRINPNTDVCRATDYSEKTMQQFCAANPTHVYCSCLPAELSRQFDVAFPVSAMREYKEMLMASPNCWSGHQCKPGVAYMDEATQAAAKSVCNYKVCIQNSTITGDQNIMEKLLMGIDCSTTVNAPKTPDVPPDLPKPPPLVVDQNQPGYSDDAGTTSSSGTSGEQYITGGTDAPAPKAGDAKDIVDKSTTDTTDTEEEYMFLIILLVIVGACGLAAIIYFVIKNDKKDKKEEQVRATLVTGTDTA